MPEPGQLSVRRGWPAAGCDELIFIRATASPDQLELLAGAVLWHPWTPRAQAW
jgi:hypothetical protein